jgi:hypothetical protein
LALGARTEEEEEASQEGQRQRDSSGAQHGRYYDSKRCTRNRLGGRMR